MGRYIIDNPEPPGAMEQFRGNVNRLGQTMLQLKMAELERKRKLEEDIAGEGRKMQGELGLLREKSKIEQESPIFRLGIKEKVASTAKAMDSTIPEAANYLGVNYQDLFGTEEQPTPKGQGIGPISMDVNPNLSGGIRTQKSVFGNLIPDTYESKVNRITGKSTVEPKTFLNPEAKIVEKAIGENIPAISKANTLDAYVNNLESMWLKTKPREKGGLKLPFLGAKDWVGAQLQNTQEDIDTKAYIDLVNATRAIPARAFGDVGNLSEYEQAAVKGSIASAITDIKKTGELKFDNLRKIVNDIKEARKRGMSLEAYQSNAGNKPVFNNQKNQQLEFSSEAEAEAANLPSGTKITISGRPALWE